MGWGDDANWDWGRAPFGRATVLPEELESTRAWFHELFAQAGRGLPWPYQLGLSVAEQVLVLGLFGHLLTSALALQARYAQAGHPGAAPVELTRLIAALEAAASQPTLPEPLNTVLGTFGAQWPSAADWSRPEVLVERFTVLLAPFLDGESVAGRGR